jgi:hypothetical protein
MDLRQSPVPNALIYSCLRYGWPVGELASGRPRCGGFGFYIAADNGGDEACQGGAEIAGGEVVAGEEAGPPLAMNLRNIHFAEAEAP